jgi:hypothetical protein
MGIGAITQAFDKERTKSTSGASITVKALQLGGDATKLANVFGKPGPDGNYNVKKCTMQDVNSCANMINDIINYARNDFASSVNFKDGESLYTFATNEMLYEDLGIQAHLPDLNSAEQEANQYLNDTITHDRTMLQYLQTYQRQSMMSKVDAITKDWLRKTTEQYEAMIKEYDKYNIIDSCYGDTNNLEQRCVDAANHVKSMHIKNQEYIDFANNLANTIFMYFPQSPKISFRYVPRDVSTFCKTTNGKHECYGKFTQFADKYGNDLQCSYCFHNALICDIDTTINSSYLHSEMSLKCAYTKDNTGNIFVRKNVPNNFENGILGWYKSDWIIAGEGENVQYYFSDSSDFLYNPI